jgi:hypothetical protein
MNSVMTFYFPVRSIMLLCFLEGAWWSPIGLNLNLLSLHSFSMLLMSLKKTAAVIFLHFIWHGKFIELIEV